LIFLTSKAFLAVPLALTLIVDPILGGYGVTSADVIVADDPPQSFTGIVSPSGSALRVTLAFPQTKLSEFPF
jgi:hypothetical protein